MAKNPVTRRDFLKGAGIGAAGLMAANMLPGCSPQASPSDGAAGDASAAAGNESGWRTAPAEITDFVEEIDCDVVVCGHGYAGLTACRELAEEGYKVYLVEKKPEDTYNAVGNEFASLNANILKERGVPEIDPVEFYQNWMLMTGNQANPELVMKFAQNSGANTDWYLSGLSQEDLDSMTTAFFPKTEHQLDSLGGIKFWASVCSFYGACNQTKIHGYNREQAINAGATFMFGTEAQYVIMQDGAVAGIVVTAPEGNIKFNCKAVVIACGGFGGNPEMMNDLIPDMYGALAEGEELSSMDANNNGRGVQMAYWAGARLESTPIPGMNMKGLAIPGKMSSLPQALWIGENGKRFCNEFYPTAEHRGLQTAYMTRKTKFAVMDDNFTTYRQYTIPQHGGFTANESNIASLRASLDNAYQTFLNGGEPIEDEASDVAAPAEGEATGGEGGAPMGEGDAPMGEGGAPMGEGGAPMGEGGSGGGAGGPGGGVTYIADDTLEGLAAQMGLEGEAIASFVQQIADWNAYCATGSDQQFGRAAEVMFPVDTPPYYAASYDPVLGETMVTCGGIITDGNQNALGADYEPIPGLYVSGNDCGRRFGYEYITPIPGCSLGMAITLGRECGKAVGQFLA